MITNTSMTLYHKTFNENTRTDVWIRYNFNNVWWFGGKGAKIDKGYENANDLDIRIPYVKNIGVDINKISVGDILVKGTLNTNISKQQDLSSYDVYNVTSIKNNTFGGTPHIRLGGK